MSRPRSLSYNSYMCSKKWEKIKDRYFNTHENVCAKCGDDELLQLHHKTYANMGHEPDEDLMILCKWCHISLHGLQHQRKVNVTTATIMFMESTKRIAIRTTRVKAQQFVCPRCGAKKGKPCIGRYNYVRKTNHIERYHVAGNGKL